LVRNVRQALDDAGFGRVRIVVSGGFDVDKIASFESEQVPTDAYGVGSAFMKGSFDFTADVVKLDGAPMSKTGRHFRSNERLVPRALMTN
jgi:nicotinate phosphoribosyltransferase